MRPSSRGRSWGPRGEARMAPGMMIRPTEKGGVPRSCGAVASIHPFIVIDPGIKCTGVEWSVNAFPRASSLLLHLGLCLLSVSLQGAASWTLRASQIRRGVDGLIRGNLHSTRMMKWRGNAEKEEREASVNIAVARPNRRSLQQAPARIKIRERKKERKKRRGSLKREDTTSCDSVGLRPTSSIWTAGASKPAGVL